MKYLTALALSFCLAAAACSSAPGPGADLLVGSWQGDARIIVTWCEQEHVPVVLEIDDQYAVSGTIGDATLVDGKLLSNRGPLGRALHVKTDWIVVADLDGPLVAAEGIQRDGIKLPLNFGEGVLRGGAHSSGTHVGGKGTMVLSATDLTLRRVGGY